MPRHHLRRLQLPSLPPMIVNKSSCLALSAPLSSQASHSSTELSPPLGSVMGSRITALLCDSADQPVSAKLLVFFLRPQSEASTLTLVQYCKSGTYI
ncbi:hypothetical protein ARMGADRAFT_479954 [Armillaria gallica]|uniref:Uncharacterized protein n=1 Tax=Armillaria gallica TaxID=47427 RepID=A0A2H3CUV1_ARMGA|nr:hypothetical protein ARMGADRAFT_479954 [Armillaria gallica]